MPCRGCRPPIVQQSRWRAAARIRWSPNVPCLDTPYAVVNAAARAGGSTTRRTLPCRVGPLIAPGLGGRLGADRRARRYSHNICVNVGGQGLDPCAVMPRPKLWGASDAWRMEVIPMALIRSGYAVSPTRRGLPGVLFSALRALALFDPGAATAQEAKQ